MRYLIGYAVLVLSLLSMRGNSQELLNRDSLFNLLRTAPNDTNKVLLYIHIGQQYENSQPDSAAYYYTNAKLLSEQLNYPIGILKYIANITYVLNIQRNLDSSLKLNLYSIELAKKIGDKQRIVASLANTGTSYLHMERYETAAGYFLEAIDLLEQLGERRNMSVIYNNLGILYTRMMQYEKAISYCKQAIGISRSLKDTPNLSSPLNTIAPPLISIGRAGEAVPYLTEALSISELTNNVYLKGSCLLNLATIYKTTGETEKQKQAALQALSISSAIDDKDGIAISYRLLADHYVDKKDFITAKQYALRSLQVTQEQELLALQKDALLILSDISIGLGHMHEHRAFRSQHDSLEAVILNQQITRNTLELETRYETVKKNTQIRELEKDRQIKDLTIRQKNTLNYLLVGLAGALLIVSLLGYRNYRQKQLLQQQRIGELEKDKQLVAVDAVLKGQEEERSRMAKDLHDGLGGLLSGVKYSLRNVKDNLVLPPGNLAVFERSLDMLDASIKELRRVAHNMMPEILVKFGLDEALRDYCNMVNATNLLIAKYQSHGMETRIDKTTEIIVYRIVQELVNNSMKHAGASEVFVQLIRQEPRLNVVVEDNGKGMDTTMLENNKGAGWVNIHSRVEYLKGMIDVHSEPGKGTLVNIEFNL